MTEKNKIYFPALDVLRFISFLMVYANHININKYLQGHSFFFLLTGFIITHASYVDIAKNSFFSLKKYLAKRWLRTLPVFYMLILAIHIGGVYYASKGNDLNIGEWWWFILCIQNNFSMREYVLIAYMWSLALTEQFYLILGFIFQFVRKYFSIIAICFIFISLIYKYYLTQYTSLFTHIGTMSLGALAYLFYYHGSIYFQRFVNLNKLTVFFLYIIALLSVYFGMFIIVDTSFYWLNELMIGLGFSFIILNQSMGVNKLFDLGRLTWFIYPGQLSYGMYLYHGIVLVNYHVIFSFLGVSFQGIFSHLFLLIITYVISMLSYEFFEKPILSFKKYF